MVASVVDWWWNGKSAAAAAALAMAAAAASCGPASIPTHLDGQLRLSAKGATVDELGAGLAAIESAGFFDGLRTYGLNPELRASSGPGDLQLLIVDGGRYAGYHLWEPDGFALIVIRADCWHDPACGWFALSHEIVESIYNPAASSNPAGEIADACDSIDHTWRLVIGGGIRDLSSYRAADGQCWPVR